MAIFRLIVLVLLLAFDNVFAQNAELPVINQIMLQTKDVQAIQNIEKTDGSVFYALQCLDKDFGIYLVKYHRDLSKSEAIAKLKNAIPGAIVQGVNKIERRYGSNDPEQSKQPYLGVIKAHQAWDYGRGGVNRRGDTIVVAVIDDGLDTLHPDLAANVWQNRLEIPWNNIDEDSNGYVDDYYGWNAGDTNNRIYTNQTSQYGHGTEVAGVLGAVGDNNMGITGINWQVKIMPIVCYPSVGFGTDVGVVNSMIYAYKMKKLWLQTKGKKGANIVAVNTSIGIDRTFPADAPLWCGMYDSLGKLGIISTGASSNVEIDVDKFGDIPSTCPSAELIVVKITDNLDKLQPSGNGLVNVDIAAPGKDIYTTILRAKAGVGLPYANVSGTSFATPQISGTVALLYNTLCDTFLSLLATNNDSALALLKGWILEGSQKLDVLYGKCVSGGRLYIERTWFLMDAWCSAHDKVYSIDKQKSLLGNSLFPNPVASGSYVNFKGMEESESEVEILDLSGRILQKTTITNGKLFIELKAGVYMVSVQNKQRKYSGKLQVY